MGSAVAEFGSRSFSAGIGKSAGEQAAKKGVILVVAELNVRGSLRSPQGRYTAFQGNVLEANRRLVVELAESVADAAQAGLRRPGVSSGRLRSALLDPRNRAVDKQAYGVGKPRFLDKSEAKYWRQIDQGYAGHVGREIRGVFGGSLSGAYGGRSRFGPYPLAGPSFTAIGEGSGGRLLPLGPRQARARLGKGSGRRPVKGIIRRPISPEKYFRRGWENFNARARTTEVVKEELKAAFGGKGVPTRALIASTAQGVGGPRPPSPSGYFKP